MTDPIDTQTSSVMEKHWERLENLDGCDITNVLSLREYGEDGEHERCFPKGYVIEGHLAEEFREHIKNPSFIPLRPKSLGAKIDQKRSQRILKSEAILPAFVQDDYQYFGTYVLIEDILNGDFNNLLREAEIARSNKQYVLARSKELVALAISGYSDLK